MRGSILVVRLGAMGDIIHALPAVASLRKSFPEQRITWVVAPRWVQMIEGNPHIDEILPFERRGNGALYRSWRILRTIQPDLAIDFQGLIQSALVGRASRPRRFVGLHRSLAREPLAALFYTEQVKAIGPHRVEVNLQLATAAGATELTDQAWIPPGKAEGELPNGAFVFASPFAGWASKQWPLENYARLAQALKAEGLPLVVNVPPGFSEKLAGMQVKVHESSLSGLIDATRRASAIVGVDSGPMHLAAALCKPGVAIFGPTDPVRNGPFHSRLAVVRAADAMTSYKRHEEIDASMRAVGVEQVKDALLNSMRAANVSA
jgi:lipopolysaccharide heptosyltransferase I